MPRSITRRCCDCNSPLKNRAKVTKRCWNCYVKLPRSRRGPSNKPPWNKGRSIFASKEEKRVYQNLKRKQRRNIRDVDISDRIRTLIRNSLRRVTTTKHSRTAILLGCSTKDFKKHLENLFTSGMNWSNYGNGTGKWNIDHIKPLARFDLTDKEQQLQAFHFSNCRPLWAIENCRRPRNAK